MPDGNYYFLDTPEEVAELEKTLTKSKDKSFLEDVKDKYLALGYGGLERLSAVGKQLGITDPESYSAIKKEADTIGNNSQFAYGLGKGLGSMSMVAPTIAAAPSSLSAIAGAMLVGGGSEGLARKSELEEDPSVHPTDAKWAAWERGLVSAPFWGLPPAIKGSIPLRMGTGAGLGIGSLEADVYRQNKVLKEYPNQQLEQFNLKNDLVAATIGSLFGLSVGKSKVRTNTKPGLSEEEVSALSRNSKPVAKTQTDAVINEMSKDAQGATDRILPTEETGLTPARTEDIVSAQERQNQSTINSEMGGGVFIRDRERINKLKNLPKQQQENAAWNQLKKEQAIDPALKRIQEDAAWASRNPPPEPSQGGRSPINRGTFNQSGAIDPETFLSLFPKFKNTKLVDSLGLPKILYHGTSKDTDFKVFKENPRGIFLTESPKEASTYSMENDSMGYTYDGWKPIPKNTSSRVMPVYANVQNPYHLTPPEAKEYQTAKSYRVFQKNIMTKAKAMGYDAVIYPDGSIAVANAAQIQSAISPGKPSVGPKKQQGSWNPFEDSNKPSKTIRPDYNTFIKNAIDQGYDSTTAAKTYRELYGEPTSHNTTIRQVKNLTHLERMETPEQAIGVAEKSADLSSPVGSPIILNQGRTAAQRTFNKGYIALVDYAESLRESIGHKIESSLKNGKNGFVEQFYGMLHKNQTDLAEVYKAIRENEFNQDYVPNFRKQSQMDLYNAYKNWQETGFNLINTELIAQGKKPLHKLPNYWPSIWRGDFTFTVKVKTETGEKLVMLVKESSKWRAQQAHKHFSNNSDYIIGPVEYTPKLKLVERKLGAGAATEDLIKLLTSDDPITREVSALWEAANTKIAYDTAQLKQHFKYKVGVKGSLGDKPWLDEKQNLQDAIRAIEDHSRSVSEWVYNQQLIRFNKSVKDNINVPKNIQRSFQNYTDDIIRNNNALALGSKISNTVIETTSKIPVVNRVIGDSTHNKSIMRDFAAWETVRLLGTNTRMLLQQEVQPIYSLLPKIVELTTSFGGSKDIISPFIIGHLQGTKLYAASKSKSMLSLLTPDEHAMLNYIKENEVADLVLIERDQFKNATVNQIYKMSGYTLKEVEAHTRFEAFNIMTNYFKASGYDLNTAMKMADGVSRELMGNYSEHVRSPLIKDTGFVGELAGRLQSFKIFQLSQLAHYLMLAKNTGNIVPAATMLSLQASLGGLIGVLGIDFAETIMDVVRWVSGKKDLPTVKETIIKSTNEHLSFGVLSTMTDMGLYGAFQFNTVGDLGWKNFLPIVGAEWDTINSIGMAAKHLGRVVQGQTSERSKKKEMLQGILPGASNLLLENTFARDTSGDILQGKTGYVVYRPKNPEETAPSAMDLLWNIPSFDRAKSKTLNYAAIQKEQAIREQLGKIKLDIIKSMFEMNETTDKTRNKLLEKTIDSLMEKYTELNPTGIGEIFDAMEKLQERKIKGDYIQNLTTADDLEQMLRGMEWEKEKTRDRTK